jgi:hypothetical protein
MAKGNSGRIVIEVNPEMKNRLHALLALKGITLKDWFVDCATDFVGEFGREYAPAKSLPEALDSTIARR